MTRTARGWESVLLDLLEIDQLGKWMASFHPCWNVVSYVDGGDNFTRGLLVEVLPAGGDPNAFRCEA